MRYASVLIGLLLVLACGKQGAKKSWKAQDLMKYDVPLVIMAPDSIEVETKRYANQKDVTIQGPGQYSVQLYERRKSANEVSQIVSELKSLVRQNRYFDSIIDEYEDGFTYKLQIDTTFVKYGFRRVRIQGNKEYIIQPGIISDYSLDEVRELYEVLDVRK